MNASNGSNLTASADSAPMRPVRRHGSSEDLGVGRNKTMHGTRTASDPEGATAALAGGPGSVSGERPYTRRHSSRMSLSETTRATDGKDGQSYAEKLRDRADSGQGADSTELKGSDLPPRPAPNGDGENG